MNRLRTHIARIAVTVLVLTGFSLYLAQPAQANQSSLAFANWLSTMAKSSDGLDLQQLNDLRQAGHLGNTIKEASQIVSRNNEDFAFSFTESTASQHIYQLLLIEWSQFQTENAMASIPTQHLAKLFVPATFDKAGTGSFSSVGTQPAALPCLISDILPINCMTVSKNVVPMVGGIAIGAP